MAEMKTSISQSQAARRCPASSPHRGRGNQASAMALCGNGEAGAAREGASSDPPPAGGSRRSRDAQ